MALGVPVGTPEFIEAHLHTVLARQASLLDTLPALHDSQENCAEERGSKGELSAGRPRGGLHNGRGVHGNGIWRQ